VRVVNFDLSLTDRSSSPVLKGAFDFGQDARFLVFAWNGQSLAWAKAPRYGSGAALSIWYHECLGDDVQFIAHISSGCTYDLKLSASQVPNAGVNCRAEMSVPSILYTTAGHGVGILAIPRELTKSRRKGLWHLRPEALTLEMAVFEQARGRSGMFTGHPFGEGCTESTSP